MNNSLETLLREAKSLAWKQTALAPEKRRMPHHLPYANPENWSSGDLVELVYQGAEAEDQLSLGVFRELIYRHGGRKLVREPASSPVYGHPHRPVALVTLVSRREVVFGRHWLEPRLEAQPPPLPESEVQELRQRLIGLIEEWSDNDGIE